MVRQHCKYTNLNTNPSFVLSKNTIGNNKKIILLISVVSGPGHPHYLGHSGHILSGPSGSHPLYRISGSNPADSTCDHRLTTSVMLVEIVTEYSKIDLMGALLIQRKTHFNISKHYNSTALEATPTEFLPKVDLFMAFKSSW